LRRSASRDVTAASCKAAAVGSDAAE